ncbi:MAG TPA: adenine phosphoribosyltransferase [Polyangia bacterium]|jgi:adenine phosphoribosyltransferase|nr:adenine phosphoribosyltransferase [Polyangia bacterium]
MTSPSGENIDERAGALRARIRDVPDFPKPGILFRDLTPLLAHGPSLRTCVSWLAERIAPHRPDLIVAVESRGFLFGAPVAASLGLGFAPVRKPGKLPWRTHRQSYALEYGSDTLEMHADAVPAGARVVIVDDLLATGGTAAATAQLVRAQQAQVAAFAFVVELTGLSGRARLGDAPIEALIRY